MKLRALLRREGGSDAPVADLDTEAMWDEINDLSAAYRESRDPDLARRILRLRHEAGIRLIDEPPAEPAYADPAFNQLPDGAVVTEVGSDQVTPELVRAGILRGGCVIVRGMVDDDAIARLTAGIDRAFAAREPYLAGNPTGDPFYEELEPTLRFDFTGERSFLNAGGGGVWAADSPPAFFDTLDAFERSGITRVVAGYLGEPPTMSVNKSVLRKVEPTLFERPTEIHGSKPSAWHQDGAFLKDVRALNVWLALSRCGDVAPGLDIVPRRLDRIVPTGTDGAVFQWSVAQSLARKEAGEFGIQRPIFEAGDVLFFDELFLHTTAAEPDMPNTRYAVEAWFFGSSGFPERYAPLAP